MAMCAMLMSGMAPVNLEILKWCIPSPTSLIPAVAVMFLSWVLFPALVATGLTSIVIMSWRGSIIVRSILVSIVFSICISFFHQMLITREPSASREFNTIVCVCMAFTCGNSMIPLVMQKVTGRTMLERSVKEHYSPLTIVDLLELMTVVAFGIVVVRQLGLKEEHVTPGLISVALGASFSIPILLALNAVQLPKRRWIYFFLGSYLLGSLICCITIFVLCYFGLGWVRISSSGWLLLGGCGTMLPVQVLLMLGVLWLRWCGWHWFHPKKGISQDEA